MCDHIVCPRDKKLFKELYCLHMLASAAPATSALTPLPPRTRVRVELPTKRVYEARKSIPKASPYAAAPSAFARPTSNPISATRVTAPLAFAQPASSPINLARSINSARAAPSALSRTPSGAINAAVRAASAIPLPKNAINADVAAAAAVPLPNNSPLSPIPEGSRESISSANLNEIMAALANNAVNIQSNAAIAASLQQNENRRPRPTQRQQSATSATVNQAIGRGANVLDIALRGRNNVKVYDVAGNGNCFWNSIKYILSHDVRYKDILGSPSNLISVADLKEVTSNFVSDHWDDHYSKTGLVVGEHSRNGRDDWTLANAIKEDRKWATHRHIQAFVDTYNVGVIVIKLDPSPQMVTMPDLRGAPRDPDYLNHPQTTNMIIYGRGISSNDFKDLVLDRLRMPVVGDRGSMCTLITPNEYFRRRRNTPIKVPYFVILNLNNEHYVPVL